MSKNWTRNAKNVTTYMFFIQKRIENSKRIYTYSV